MLKELRWPGDVFPVPIPRDAPCYFVSGGGKICGMERKASPNPGALYVQVAGKVEALIRAGALRAGERVPSVRRASAQHGVSVMTVVQAYVTLENRGLIEARPKAGFFVRAQLRDRVPEPAASQPAAAATKVEVGSLQSKIFEAALLPGVVPFGAAYPGPENLPVLKLNRIMASVARSAGAGSVGYDMPPGCEALRRQLAKRSLDWGTQLSPDDFITTCGGTEALALCYFIRLVGSGMRACPHLIAANSLGWLGRIGGSRPPVVLTCREIWASIKKCPATKLMAPLHGGSGKGSGKGHCSSSGQRAVKLSCAVEGWMGCDGGRRKACGLDGGVDGVSCEPMRGLPWPWRLRRRRAG